MTLDNLKRAIRARFSEAGVADGDNAVLEMLLGHVFGFSRNFIISEFNHEIDEKSDKYRELMNDVELVISGTPIQHITGFADFCALKFHVNEDVLIPRQETELLIKIAIHRLKKAGKQNPRVLDLCSGSGAIGISVKNYFRPAVVTLSDISEKAIEVARQNARDILGSEDAVTFLQGSFLEPVLQTGEKFDMFLSNPPYIKTSALAALPKNVINHDPTLALDGGEDGVKPYRIIVKDLSKILNDGAMVGFEIGETQGEIVSSLLKLHGYDNVEVLKDLNGCDRFVCAIYSEKCKIESTKILSPDESVGKLGGIGPKSKAALEDMGVFTIGDLAEFYPKSYQDRTNFKTVAEAKAQLLESGSSEPALFTLTIEKPKLYGKYKRQIITFNAHDITGNVRVVFFNTVYILGNLFPGQTYYFFGHLTENSGNPGGTPDIVNPQLCNVLSPDAKEFLKIKPIYRERGSIRQGAVRKAVKSALAVCCDEFDLPDELREKYDVLPRLGALSKIHFPVVMNDVALAVKRLAFDELLTLFLRIQSSKQDRLKNESNGISFERVSLDPLISALPYTLTKGQQETVSEILSDMENDLPMNRLVIGDVGSGKTAIALFAIYNAIKNGTQAAFMVPSTVLADQHYRKLKPLLESLGIDVFLLHSGVSSAQKKFIKEKIRTTDTFLVIGTHSLISEGVEFGNLGLVVTDEQHRFGVNQRRKIIGSYSRIPDVLSLSATPIPRTLALVVYGDMDISYLKEKPAGRHDVITSVRSSSQRKKIYQDALKAVSEGRQVYIVHACISDPLDELELNEEDFSDKDIGKKLLSCTDNFKTESQGIFSGVRTALLHGKMKETEKNEIMERFANGEIDVLFSTTVIEVGIDVPNATLMIIENAERFGLSQLHQLRGRVGRGSHQSECILISQNSDGNKRLQIMNDTYDGFKIADEDLKLRGPGEFFGTKQSGIPCFNLANPLGDRQLLESARECATLLLNMEEGHDYVKKVIENSATVVL